MKQPEPASEAPCGAWMPARPTLRAPSLRVKTVMGQWRGYASRPPSPRHGRLSLSKTRPGPTRPLQQREGPHAAMSGPLQRRRWGMPSHAAGSRRGVARGAMTPLMAQGASAREQTSAQRRGHAEASRDLQCRPRHAPTQQKPRSLRHRMGPEACHAARPRCRQERSEMRAEAARRRPETTTSTIRSERSRSVQWMSPPQRLLRKRAGRRGRALAPGQALAAHRGLMEE